MSAAGDEPAVTLRRLLPEPGELTAAELADELTPWEDPPPGRPHVALNMVQTADGRASVNGRTAAMSSAADRQVFHALRTRVDAVMVGAGTARIERYGRIVRDAALRERRRAAGLRPDPLAVIVSGSLDLPDDLPLLQDPDSQVVIVTASRHALEHVRADVHYLRYEAVDLPATLSALREDHGVRAVLCEGGPRLNGSLIAAGLIDELFLTAVGLLAGDAGARSIVEGAPLPEPSRLQLRGLLEHEGELFARYAIARP